MNEGTAIEIAKFKMKELGVGRKYLLRYRHFHLDLKEKREIKGENHLFILVSNGRGFKVESKAGIFNLMDNGVNEQQHVHRGLIQIENTSRRRIEIKFIQVIPLLKEEK